ncbi:MAG: hypothetical protein H6581_13350 [Bacteroidia bacterium]|nr:hypothetical protein [Bacteroidia bacterium]
MTKLRLGGWSGSDRGLPWAGFLLAFGVLLLVKLGAGFNGLYGQDPFEYLRYSERLGAFLRTGIHPGDYNWPVLYPLLGAVFGLLAGSESLALQLISMLAFAGVVGIGFAWLIHQGHKKHLVFYFLLCLTSAYFFRIGLTVMSESLCMAWICLCYYGLLRQEKGGGGHWLAVAALGGAAAVMTRYGAGVIILPGAARGVWFAVKNRQWAGMALALVMGILPFIPHYLIRAADSGDFLGHPWFQTWSPLNAFSSSFSTPEGNAQYLLPNILYAISNWVHPGFLPPGVLMLAFVRKNLLIPSQNKLLLAAILAYALFLMGIPYQNNRFLLLTLPLVFWFLMPAADNLFVFLQGKWKFLPQLLLILMFLLGIGLNVRALWPLKVRSALEKEIYQCLEALPRHKIYAFDVDVALKGYHCRHNLVNLYEIRLDTAEKGEWVLFNAPLLEKQWTGYNPMLNWEWLNENFTLVPVQEFSDGWTLYELN